MKVFSVAFFRNWASPYESERAGAGRGVFFVNYLRSLVRNHWAVWPDWQLVIHHDDKAREFPYWKCIERMADRGLLKISFMGEAKLLCQSMLWRMIPAWNLSVDVLLCRDLDSLSTPRERRAIEKWLTTDKAVSSLHDSESHGNGDLFGGLCGFKAQWIRDRWASYNEFIWRAKQLDIDLTYQGSDMRLLNAELMPKAIQEDQVITEDRASLGPKDHPIDAIGTHCGGAYHVQPVVEWFVGHREYCPKLDIIEECEAGYKHG